MTTPSPGTAHLHASEHVHLSTEDARRLFGSQAAAWLGPETEDSPQGRRRFATDLRLGSDDHGLLAPVRKAAYVDLGAPELGADGLRVEISWRSASLAPLFPVFSGWLTIRPGELVLDGYYAPPGGAIGLLADRALLHLAAERTATSLLHQLRAVAASGRVEARVQAEAPSPKP